VFKFLHADGAAANLVLVGRTDTAPRGADALLLGGCFAQLVELAMQGKDQGGVLGDLQIIRIDLDAALSQSIDLAHQMPRVDHDAIADDAELAGAHHTGGQQRELEGLIADDEGVARVVAALEAHDDVSALRQPVDNLALALVAPLGANHYDVRHLSRHPIRRQRPISTYR
jgi:hypothetical protein